MSPLKFVSLNCEGHRHLEARILPFFEREQPDVAQLQEIYATDIPLLQQATGMHVVSFAPMANLTKVGFAVHHGWGTWGICQLSRHPVTNLKTEYYYRSNPDERVIPEYTDDHPTSVINRAVSLMTVTKEDRSYRFANTHFTWSKLGEASPEQLRDLAALFAVLDSEEELILSGDFNAPRGNETFRRLAERYTDNIPAHYTTSLDEHLHRVGKIELMVDGLFTTPHYQATTVRLQDGVSDHMAIVADILKA